MGGHDWPIRCPQGLQLEPRDSEWQLRHVESDQVQSSSTLQPLAVVSDFLWDPPGAHTRRLAPAAAHSCLGPPGDAVGARGASQSPPSSLLGLRRALSKQLTSG